MTGRALAEGQPNGTKAYAVTRLLKGLAVSDDLLHERPTAAQVEGPTFWGSTMQYHLAFMDPLQRVTGEDLFTPFADKMNAGLALATVAAIKTGGHDQDHETVVLEPSYGQINYYSPVLLGLARFYRDTLCQYLAPEVEGYQGEKVVGLGLLRMKDPLPMSYMLVKAEPENGRLECEVRRGDHARSGHR